jgi:hypothetical protein
MRLHLKRLFFTLGIGLLTAGLLSCKHADRGGELKHDMGSFVISSSPMMWQDLTSQEFDDIYIPANGWESPDSFYPETGEATQRMNTLLKHIHETLKRKFPAQLAHAPIPRARIYKGNTSNAFVTMVPVCYRLDVRLKEKQSDKVQAAEAAIDYVTMNVNGDLFGEKGSTRCLEKSISSHEAMEYFTWINHEIRRSEAQNGKTEHLCQIGFQTTKAGITIVPGQYCKRGPEIANVSLAKGLRIWKTQPYIVLYGGLINQLDSEIKIMTTLAHELGHYYRSHVNPFHGDYGYFYAIAEARNPDHKPQRDLSLQERGEQILAAARLVQTYVYRENNQRYPSELFYPIWALAAKACPEQGACPSACADLVKTVHDEAIYQAFGDWPYGKMPAGGSAAYALYEKHLAACSPHLKISSAVSGGENISLGDLTDALRDEKFTLVTQSMGLSDDAGFLNSSLSEVIEKLSAGLSAAQNKARGILDQAINDNIGYYTTEQEADELQMEIVALLGLDPRQLVIWDIDYYRDDLPTWEKYQGFHMDRCKKLLLEDWREEGRVVIAPIANYHDDHHSGCFRIFNTYREIEAHGLKADPEAGAITFLSDEQWQSLQKSVNGDLAAPAPAPTEPIVTQASVRGRIREITKVRPLGSLELVVREKFSEAGKVMTKTRSVMRSRSDLRRLQKSQTACPFARPP